jgi:NADH dehydrogenase
MKSLADAVYLRNRLIEHLEEADFECSTLPPEQLLTFAVAGGGFAGVETVAAVNDFLREALNHYPHLNEAMLRVVLVEHGPMILPELGPELAVTRKEKLAQRKIEFRLGRKVTGVSERGVELSDGTTLRQEHWSGPPARRRTPLLDRLTCAKERGRIAVNEYLEVQDTPASGRSVIAPRS